MKKAAMENEENTVAESAMSPFPNFADETAPFISPCLEISEPHSSGPELQQSQKMDVIGRLASGVAHDFNNLLMIVIANTELMLDVLSAEHPLRKNAYEIMNASRCAADLTRQLLTFARKQEQSARVLDLNSVIMQICGLVQRLLGEDIPLIFSPGDDLGKVKIDAGQIQQVVMNLAANARDAMPHGGKLIIVTSEVSLEKHGVDQNSPIPEEGYVLLSITDSGDGISAEHLPHVFEPFYTTKKPGEGTGLGLAMVHAIVKENGGFVSVSSEPRQGTNFKIYLPRFQSGLLEVHPAKVLERVPCGSETLLLAEDEPAVRQAARAFLTRCGYAVLEARNGEDALRISRQCGTEIELMITDVVMPGISGQELAAQLAHERPNMRTLFISGHTENTVLQHGSIVLASCFLQKPFSMRTLAKKVRETLEMNAKSRAATASACG